MKKAGEGKSSVLKKLWGRWAGKGSPKGTRHIGGHLQNERARSTDDRDRGTGKRQNRDTEGEGAGKNVRVRGTFKKKAASDPTPESLK